MPERILKVACETIVTRDNATNILQPAEHAFDMYSAYKTDVGKRSTRRLAAARTPGACPLTKRTSDRTTASTHQRIALVMRLAPRAADQFAEFLPSPPGLPGCALTAVSRSALSPAHHLTP